MHHRFLPRVHHFDYRIFMFAVDLDRLRELPSGNALLSVNRRNLYSLREDDYMPTREPIHNGSGGDRPPDAASGLKARVVAYLAHNGVAAGDARIVLVTLPRVAGYLFNPVSFYFCFDAGGRPMAAIAEVTNTFREVKHFFLGPASLSAGEGVGAFRLRMPKHFYVSPFSDVDVSFDFTLRPPGDGLAIQIDDYRGGERTLTSTLTGRRVPLTSARLAWFSVKYPLITLRVIVLIHLHALLLRLKGVPWFAKAARAGDQKDLYRPHDSIASTPLN